MFLISVWARDRVKLNAAMASGLSTRCGPGLALTVFKMAWPTCGLVCLELAYARTTFEALKHRHSLGNLAGALCGPDKFCYFIDLFTSHVLVMIKATLSLKFFVFHLLILKFPVVCKLLQYSSEICENNQMKLTVAVYI